MISWARFFSQHDHRTGFTSASQTLSSFFSRLVSAAFVRRRSFFSPTSRERSYSHSSVWPPSSFRTYLRSRSRTAHQVRSPRRPSPEERTRDFLTLLDHVADDVVAVQPFRGRIGICQVQKR